MPLDLQTRQVQSVAPPRLPQVHASDVADHRAELLAGLQAEHAFIAPKLFYDALGARLFDAITALPEYTLTRTEAAILRTDRRRLLELLPAVDAFALVDLGAGNCAKAAALFDGLPLAHYVAVDIAAPLLQDSLAALQPLHPQLPMIGVCVDFTQGLELPLELELQLADVPRLLLYLGSSIGNFAPAQAEQFLRAAHATAGPGGALIIGVDLVKSPHCLQAAYDDALGVTAAFNRNVLNRVNRLVGTDFNLADWQHVAFFDAQQCCVQMHLRPRRPLVPVHWPGGGRVFAVSDGIHTENAYKYTVDGFGALLQRAGWTLRHTLVDSVESVSASEFDNVTYSAGSRTGSDAGYAVFIAHA